MCKNCVKFKDYYYNLSMIMFKDFNVIADAADMRNLMNMFSTLNDLQKEADKCANFKDEFLSEIQISPNPMLS